MGVVDRHNGTVPIVLYNLCTDLFTNYVCRDIDIEFVRFSCNCFFLCHNEAWPHNDDDDHRLRRRVSRCTASRSQKRREVW